MHIFILNILLLVLSLSFFGIMVYFFIKMHSVIDNINLTLENIQRKKQKLASFKEAFSSIAISSIASRVDLLSQAFSGALTFLRTKKKPDVTSKVKKCVVIYNPSSGRCKRKNIFRILYRVLEKYGYETTVISTEYSGHASEIVANMGYADLVISAGGDGTLSEVMDGNLRRENKLVIANIPLGSTNDVGIMYGYTKNYRHNLELLLNGQVKNVDVCMINDRSFVYVAAFGNYVDISYVTPQKLKEKYGHLAYIIYGLKMLKKNIQKYDIKYTIDGKTYETTGSFLFVTNSTRIAGMNNVYEEIKLDDGLFEVLICDIKNKHELVKRINDIQWMNVADIPGFTYYRTNNLIVEFKNKQPSSWCIDGDELAGRVQKYVFKINNETQVLVPKKNINKLFIN